MVDSILKLADGTIVRKEAFGYFLAFPNGEMGFFNSVVGPFLKRAATDPLPKSWFLPFKMNHWVDFPGTRWKYALRHPLIVCLELTLLCNASCDICYINAGKPRLNELTPAQHRILWRQLVESGVCCVQLTGGEPLLSPLVLEAIEFFHANGVVVSLVTNGICLTKEFINSLPHSDFGVGISIDAYSINQDIRGPLFTFEQLKQKVELLQGENIPFNVMVTLSKLNIAEVLPLIKWCRRNNVMLETLEAQGIGRAASNRHLLLNADDLPMDAIIYRAKEELEDEYEEHHERAGRYFAGFLDICFQHNMATGRCKGGRSIAYIASDGTVYPCSNCAGAGILATGNVAHTPFGQLWRDGFKKIRSITWDDFKECRYCELSKQPYYCPCRCPALSFENTRELTRPGCNPYMKGAVMQRAHIHEKMHASQKPPSQIRKGGRNDDFSK